MDPNDLIPPSMAAPPKEPDWSPMQRTVFEHTAQTEDNLLIEAVAGSGKTTTIIKAIAMLPPGTNACFLAFNKAIADKLGREIPAGQQAKTFNALGHGLLMRRLRSMGENPRLNAYRLGDYVRAACSEDDWEEYGQGLRRMVALARHSGIGIGNTATAAQFRNMMGDFEVDIPITREGRAAGQAVRILHNLIQGVTTEFDFDDQLYMPLFWGLPFHAFDCILVDETQDLSPIQHMMLAELGRQGARIIGVGDTRQAIYGFRGADSNSMETMGAQFGMVSLPLSISYRCPKAVVREAQKLVPHIEAAPNADEGLVEQLKEYPELECYERDCMILCRMNGPLFRLALEFLADGRPCHLMSNFGKDLVKFVRSFKCKKASELLTALNKWRDVEVANAESKGYWGKAEFIRDKHAAIVPFCDRYEVSTQVVAALQQLLTTTSGPKLSTVHKAKGLEAPHVYILEPNLLPSPRAKTEAQMAQERNLHYVAITRALETLTYLPLEENRK